MIIEAGLTRYEAVNKEIEKQLEKQNKVTVKDVNGQRYIGCALDEGKTIEVYGTPGNDMACYLNGGRLVGFVLINSSENAGIYTNLISNKVDLSTLEGDIMETPSIFLFDKDTRIQKLRGGILL